MFFVFGRDQLVVMSLVMFMGGRSLFALSIAVRCFVSHLLYLFFVIESVCDFDGQLVLLHRARHLGLLNISSVCVDHSIHRLKVPMSLRLLDSKGSDYIHGFI